MNPIKLIRKLGKVLRGGASRRAVFLGIFLGFGIGMIPGVNLTLIIFIAAFFLLNSNGAMGAIFIFLGKLLCLAAAPLTYEFGRFLIHDAGLAGLVQYCAETPGLALLDLQVYCLIGALPIIIVGGGLAGWLVGRLMDKLRDSLAGAKGKSARLDKVSQNVVVRGFLRVAFGKKIAPDKIKQPLIRIGRLVAVVVVVAAVFVLQMLYLNSAVRVGIESGLGSANGAEVNLGKAELSLGDGLLILTDLQVTDPQRPENNRVQAERIVLKVSVADMLAKRFVVDLIECDKMQTDTLRESPGEVYLPAEEQPKAPAQLIDLSKFAGKSAEYYGQIKKFNERLKKLTEYLNEDDPNQAKTDEERLAKLARDLRSLGYLKLSAKEFLAKNPTWIIRKVSVTQLELAPGFPTFTIEGKNLSSHPSLCPEPMSLKALPDKDALKKITASSGNSLGNGLGGLFKKDADKKTEESTPEKPAPAEKADEKKADEKSGGLLKGLLGK